MDQMQEGQPPRDIGVALDRLRDAVDLLEAGAMRRLAADRSDQAGRRSSS